MPHLSELHGAATHLATVAIPLYAVLLILRRTGKSGEATHVWEPWVLGGAVVGVVATGVTGLLVRGQSTTELRGSDYGIGGIHFYLGIGIAVLVVAMVVLHARRRTAAALATLTVLAVGYQGYLGGRMAYDQGVGVQAMGESQQTARAASTLHLALARGTAPAQAGKVAFQADQLGCASCHGDQAQGDRGPRLAGGKEIAQFRHVHANGLFPPSVVTDRDFAAIDTWLKTLGPPGPSGDGD